MAKSFAQAIEDRQRGQNRVMQELFNLGREAATFPGPELSPEARQALTDAQVRAMAARTQEARAKEIFDAKRVEFEEVEETFQREIEARKDEIQEALFGPAREEDPAVMLQFAAATENALRNVLEAAVLADNERTIQQVLLACEARDEDEIAAILGDLIPETQDLLGELAQIDSTLEDLGDPGDLFSAVAPEPPSAERILTA